jgi:protein-tyrosine phosphatase
MLWMPIPRLVTVVAFGQTMQVLQWTEILPGLYQGVIPDGPLPVDCILDLFDRAAYEHGASERRAFHLSDGDTVPPELDDLAAWVTERLDQGKSVYVHCAAGLNRSGLVVARVLVARGMTGKDAIALLRNRRSPAVLCNEAFADHIRSL